MKTINFFLKSALLITVSILFAVSGYAQEFDGSKYYRLTTKWQGEGKSLDVVNDGKNNKLQLAKTGKYSGQYWKISPMGNGYYRLTTKWQGEGKSLDVVNDGKNNKLQLAKTGRYSGQYWKISPMGNGYYRLTTKWQGEGKSLDVVNDGKNNKLQLAKTGKYSGQYWKISEISGTGTNTAAAQAETYIVELLGRQGKVKFPKPLRSKPVSGTLTLLDKNGREASSYQLVNGEWKGDKFLVDIMEANDPSKAASLPGAYGHHLKLKTSDSGLAFVGTISNSKDSDYWSSGKTNVVLGYDGKHPIVKTSSQNPLFTLVINDKHADKKWDRDAQKYLDKYSYGWYIEPRKAVSDNFRMVHIVIDELLEEVALYAFDNSDGRQNNLSKFKLHSYPTGKIKAELKKLYPKASSYGPNTDLKADLGALLINKAQLTFPSKYLGLKSSGHGSPNGIMNGFFEEQTHIRSALRSIKEVRGKNIDFLDFITNCNVASLHNLSAVADYVDYVTASDLTRMSPVEYIPVDLRPSSNYITYFQDERQTVSQILSAMVNKWGEILVGEPGKKYASKNNMTAKSDKGYEQQATLFDMKKLQTVFKNLGGNEQAYATCVQKAKADPSALSGTVYYDGDRPYYSFAKAIPILFPGYQKFAADYKAAIIAQVDNRQQFDWGDQKGIPTGIILARKY